MHPDIRFSIRSLVRQKWFTALHIIGLSLGISVTLVIVIFINNELSFDRFHTRADEVYRINSTWKESGKEFNMYATPLPLAGVIKTEIPGIETIARVFPQFKGTISINQETVISQDHILIADATFLEIFDINVIHGDKRALAKPYQALISESTAKKLFGDHDPLGRSFRYRGNYDINVAGVFEDIPRNTNLPFSVLIAYVDDKTFLNNGDTWYFGGAEWTTLNAITFAVLPSASNRSEVQSALDRVANEHINSGSANNGIHCNFSLQPLAELHLDSSKFSGGPWVPAMDTKWLFIFGGIALLVLSLACVNFINLVTGQSIARAREAGIRKTIGGTRSQLIFQMLMEPMLLVFFSAFVAVLIALRANDLIEELSGKSIDIWTAITPVSVSIFVVSLLLTVLVAGWYPAWLLVRTKTILLIKPGKQSILLNNSLLRTFLIVFQFSVSAILMTIVFVLAKQVQYIESKDLGFTKNDIVAVALPDRTRTQSLIKKVNEIPGVVETSLSRIVPMSDNHWWNTMGKLGTEEVESVCVIHADDNYTRFYNIKLLSGKVPSSTDTAGNIHRVLVNEKLVRSLGLGTNDEAIGKRFSWAGIAEISGVIADFNSEPLHYGIAPTLIYQDPEVYSWANIKLLNADKKEIFAKIRGAWQTEFPLEPYEPKLLTDQINDYYKGESVTYKMFLTFACIAVLISCLGLFGLCFLGTVRRAKEISIRRILGASVEGVAVLLSNSFLKPILMACVVALPLAWWCVKIMLDFYEYRLIVKWWLFGAPMALLICVALVTTLTQTIRTSLSDPVKNLKSE